MAHQHFDSSKFVRFILGDGIAQNRQAVIMSPSRLWIAVGTQNRSDLFHTVQKCPSMITVSEISSIQKIKISEMKLYCKLKNSDLQKNV